MQTTERVYTTEDIEKVNWMQFDLSGGISGVTFNGWIGKKFNSEELMLHPIMTGSSGAYIVPEQQEELKGKEGAFAICNYVLRDNYLYAVFTKVIKFPHLRLIELGVKEVKKDVYKWIEEGTQWSITVLHTNPPSTYFKNDTAYHSSGDTMLSHCDETLESLKKWIQVYKRQKKY